MSVNDYRRASGEGRAGAHSSTRDSAGRSGLVPSSGYRTSWGRELSAPSSVDPDRTLTQPRPDSGARDSDDVSTFPADRSGRRSDEQQTRIAILGSGPAGLLAAHAVRLHGFRPVIFSQGTKSMMHGAIYLHAPIPHLTSDVQFVDLKYLKRGTREGYANKVYGNPCAPCSWDDFGGKVTAYSMKQAYTMLWIKYNHTIRHMTIHRDGVEKLLENYHIVINTIPAPTLCMYPNLHKFESQKIWVDNRMPWLQTLPDNTIIYNGQPDDYWYRASSIFGSVSVEVSDLFVQNHPSIKSGNFFKPGVKPVSNICDCHPRFDRAGRFGIWRKGILAHQAFRQAIEILEKHGVVDALF